MLCAVETFILRCVWLFVQLAYFWLAAMGETFLIISVDGKGFAVNKLTFFCCLAEIVENGRVRGISDNVVRHKRPLLVVQGFLATDRAEVLLA